MQKTAIITGAARNIGKGIAKGLLEAGYTCILIDNDESELEKTHHELLEHDNCFKYVLDMSDTNAILIFIDWIRSDNLNIDVLVNNVGFESQDTVLDLRPESVVKSNKSNLDGPFFITSLISKMMISKNVKGNIVFISSTHSNVIRNHPLYSSSKAAIEMFMKEAALELSAHNIRVNALSPGPVQDTTELKPNKYVPLGYSLQPVDIADSLLFLISDKARFITAQTLIVDGGFSAAHTHHWIKQNKL